MEKNKLYPKMKCSFLYRIQGGNLEMGASRVLLEIDNGKLKYNNRPDNLVYIGTREHMWYFLRKRSRFHKKITNIKPEKYDEPIPNPVNVLVMVVPSWYKRLINMYAEDPGIKNGKYKKKSDRYYTPEITDISTPGDCFGIAFYFKDLLSELTIYCEQNEVKTKRDFISLFDDYINVNQCNARKIDVDKVAQIISNLNSKLIELNTEPIPKRMIESISKDLPGFGIAYTKYELDKERIEGDGRLD